MNESTEKNVIYTLGVYSFRALTVADSDFNKKYEQYFSLSHAENMIFH